MTRNGVKRFLLTSDVRVKILNGIRAGGYAQVAAEAWGIPVRVLHDWLERGRGAKAREPYRSFAREFEEAQAQARLHAEIQLYQAEPRIWLEHGPGRETADRPGWTAPVKAAECSAENDNLLLNVRLVELLRGLVGCMNGQPELRRQAAAFLVEKGFGDACRAA